MAVPGAPQPPKPQTPEDLQKMRSQFFEARRGDLERQNRGQQQEVGDAISRRFTAMGQAGSGAAINAQIKAAEVGAANARAANNELAGQELQGHMYDQDQQFKQNVFDFEKQQKLSAMDLERQQFEQDKAATAYNAAMTQLASPYSARRVNEGIQDYLKMISDMKYGRR